MPDNLEAAGSLEDSHLVFDMGSGDYKNERRIIWMFKSGAYPANQARADETMGFDIPGLPEITVSSPNDVAPVLSAVVANSNKVAAAMGTSSMFVLEANLLLNEATQAIATQTQLSAFITTVSGTPIVEVSSVSGSDAVTLATGSGSATVLAGQTFTAAVDRVATNKNGAQELAVHWHKGLATMVVGALAVGAAMIF